MRRVVLALAFLLVACNGDTDVELAPVPTDAPITTVAGATTTTFAGSTSAVSTPPTEYRYLKAVRVGEHDGFDRVVFEFESGIPGYSVQYVDRPITEDGSGDTVDVDGDAVLSVRMEAASGADLTGADLREVYKGPRRIDGPGEAVQEVVRTGDFEAVLNWVIGVDANKPFHAYTTGGNRLVIDIAH